MSARWKYIDTLPDDIAECPDMILVWNDCNGPELIWLGADYMPHELKDGCWIAWCECPSPSEAEEKRLIARHAKEWPDRVRPPIVLAVSP